MGDYDVTYYMWMSYLWAVLECGLGIVAACMPSLTPLLIRYVPTLTPPPPPKCRYPHPGSQSKIRSTIARAFPNLHSAHSYPLANISTTVTGVRWDESEDTVHGDGDGDGDGGRGDKAWTPTEGQITKTTVIEQTIHVMGELLSS